MSGQIAVLCGSAVPLRPVYRQEARALGLQLSLGGFSVLCGGKITGLMIYVVRGVRETGGEICGFPTLKEVSEGEKMLPLTHHTVVESPLDRQRRLWDESDAVVVFPGGWGTLGFLGDLLSQKRETASPKPLVLLNTMGYWDRFLTLMVYMRDEGFLHDADTELFQVTYTPQETVSWLHSVL